MIIKIKLSPNSISSWGFYEANEIFVHKKYANEITGCYSFYETSKVKSLEANENGQFPIMYWICLVNSEKNRIEGDYKIIVTPVSGSEIYLLNNQGKTIEKLN